MNIVLWILQVLLAFHTAAGALWKFSNTAEQTMPSLSAISEPLWMVLCGVELLCAVALILPAVNEKWAATAPLAAVFLIGEMLLFCGLHLASGVGGFAPMIYWLVVAAVCAFVAWGRLSKKGAA